MKRSHDERGGRISKKLLSKKHKRPQPLCKIDLSWVEKYSDKIKADNIPCQLCKNKKMFTSWDKFADHLRQTHAITKAHLQGTYIGAQLQQSKRTISIEELSCVDVDPSGDETRFKCLLCEEDTSIHSKGNALRHMLRHGPELQERGLSLDSISRWIVVREGNALKQGRRKKLSLTAALQIHGGCKLTRCVLLF